MTTTPCERLVEAWTELDGLGRCTLGVEDITLELFVLEQHVDRIVLGSDDASFVVRLAYSVPTKEPAQIVAMNDAARALLRAALDASDFQPISSTLEPSKTIDQLRRARMH